MTKNELITPEQLGTELGISIQTLATWRSTGRHSLPYVKVGSRVRYSRSDVEAWLIKRQSSGNEA